MIPYGRQDISESDIEAVVKVLRSDFLTQGPAVTRFERAVADKVGASFALATNSATSALHLACLALDLGQGDLLWTTPVTFVASANCGIYCGAEVDFVDIDPDTYNLCPTALALKLEEAKRSGRLPKVVVAVHLCGQSCEMQALQALAEEYGFRLIEDASHAIGGKYLGRYIGGCQYSDITIFSFHPVKIITTGEGGMALTNQPELDEKMRLLVSHGITRDPTKMTHGADGSWYYQQVALGFNYRMTDIQAALGFSQLQRLDEYVDRRHVLAERYDQEFANLPLKTPVRKTEGRSSFHLYVVRVGADRRGEIFEALRERGIGVNVHYIPVHTQPYYRDMGFKEGDFPESERYYQEAISLPLYPGLSLNDQNTVVAAVKELIPS
tara:strand:+ start:2085 stop:3233 length:1149 start_codon:yes stop_codon:yes gene_type:complete